MSAAFAAFRMINIRIKNKNVQVPKLTIKGKGTTSRQRI